MAQKQYWIQEAIIHPGALTNYVKRKYGKRGFIKRKGRWVIRRKILERLAKKKGKVGKRARLALTLRKFRK